MSIHLGPIDKDDPAIAIYENLPPRANLFIRMFGKKAIKTENNVRLVTYLWRGRLYYSSAIYEPQ